MLSLLKLTKPNAPVLVLWVVVFPTGGVISPASLNTATNDRGNGECKAQRIE